MEALVVYFDALIKFKRINIPAHSSYALRQYCLKREVKTFRGELYKKSRIIYIK